LLEAMEERQISIGDESFPLPSPFFVMATQNPVELEGTYPLPEAQIDRFLVKLDVPYPSELEERAIVDRDAEAPGPPEPVCDAAGVNALQQAASEIHVAPEVRDYAVRLARATREPESVGAEIRSPSGSLVKGSVSLGASPRASLHLVRAARARALLEHREFATPHDVKGIAHAVLRHRVIVTYEAEADGVTPEIVVRAILDSVETP
jgi:MoxR-like ATPase